MGSDGDAAETGTHGGGGGCGGASIGLYVWPPDSDLETGILKWVNTFLPGGMGGAADSNLSSAAASEREGSSSGPGGLSEVKRAGLEHRREE